MTTGTVQNTSTWKKKALLTAALAAVIVLAWSAHTNFNNLVEIHNRAKLAPAGELVNHPLDSVGEALAALQIQGSNGDTTDITVQVWGGDREELVKHVYNIAVQKGWYPHSRGDVAVKIVLPAGEETSLTGITEDPYGWVQTHKDATADAKEIALGNAPAYVNLTTHVQDRGKASWHGVGMVLSAGFGLFILGLMAMEGVVNFIRRRPKIQADTRG